jgi:anti-anti-sigma factor
MGLVINISKREDGGIVVALKGALDSESYQEFEAKMLQSIPHRPSSVVLDMRLLEYISSMGISALFKLRKLTEERGSNLAIINVPLQIQEVFRIIQTLPDIPLFKDIEEADRYFAEIQKQVKEKGLSQEGPG